MLLGFRGQGQTARGRGLGREVGQVAGSLEAALGGTPVQVVRVPFPARSGDDATSAADVATAVSAARRVIRSTCRRVVLVGYSQGAEVVHRVTAALPRRVALAVLMGDPLRDPADRATTLTLGTGTLAGRGNAGPGRRLPVVVRSRVLEVCVRGDDVCNAPLTGRVGPASATHRTAYQSTHAAQVIARRAARLAAGS